MNSTINGLDINNLGATDIYSLSLCLAWLSDHSNLGTIECVGYNENSGNAYIAFSTGDTIYSGFGKPVEFMKYEDEEIEITASEFINRNTVNN